MVLENKEGKETQVIVKESSWEKVIEMSIHACNPLGQRHVGELS